MTSANENSPGKPEIPSEPTHHVFRPRRSRPDLKVILELDDGLIMKLTRLNLVLLFPLERITR